MGIEGRSSRGSGLTATSGGLRCGSSDGRKSGLDCCTGAASGSSRGRGDEGSGLTKRSGANGVLDDPRVRDTARTGAGTVPGSGSSSGKGDEGSGLTNRSGAKGVRDDARAGVRDVALAGVLDAARAGVFVARRRFGGGGVGSGCLLIARGIARGTYSRFFTDYHQEQSGGGWGDVP
jgi:hypothetical protein